jgi:hypothetical protein
MAKQKFSAAAWVDCVDAIPGIEIYVSDNRPRRSGWVSPSGTTAIDE